MMKHVCFRCGKGKAPEVGHTCKECKLDLEANSKPPEGANDEDVLGHYVNQRVLIGCRECGTPDFGYEAGTKTEKALKYFVLFVRCQCGANYMDMLEVRTMRLEDVGIEESE